MGSRTTTLVVVHRPSTVALVHQVALLERGRISAVGSHHELLERVPSYRAILAEGVHEEGGTPVGPVVTVSPLLADLVKTVLRPHLFLDVVEVLSTRDRLMERLQDLSPLIQ